MFQRMTAVIVFLGALACVNVMPASSASYQVTIGESTSQPVVGHSLVVRGAVSGGPVARVILQNLAGDRWSTIASHAPSASKYALSASRVGPGALKYRTLALNSRGGVLATSKTVTATWFSWQSIVDTNEASYNVAVYTGSYSFAGRRYPHSFDLEVDATTNTVAQFNLHGVCRAVRFSSGYQNDTNGAYTRNVQIRLDGNLVYNKAIIENQTSAPVQALSVLGHTQMTWIFAENDGVDHGDTFSNPTIGTPQALCRTLLS